jgi:hypothetical protein
MLLALDILDFLDVILQYSVTPRKRYTIVIEEETFLPAQSATAGNSDLSCTQRGDPLSKTGTLGGNPE